MKNCIRLKLGSILLFVSILCGFFASEVFALEPDITKEENKHLFSMQEDTEFVALSNLVINLLERRHYSHLKPDNNLSEQIFLDYFKILDRNKYYFLASDIEAFEIYRYQLDDLIKRGDIGFAFHVFNLFVKRIQERVKYAKKILKKENPFDYTLDEEINTDREDSPWAKSKEKLDELWRKRVKNKLLSYQLMEESFENGKEDDEKKIKDHKLFSMGTPKERVCKYYDRLIDQFLEYEKIDILELFLTTVSKIYDPHSTYMSPKTLEDFNISMKLSLEGIGAMLQYTEGYTKVVRIIPGGPASKDGRLKAGDRIIAVAQAGEEPIDVIEMPLKKTVDMIRGKSKTTVILTIIDGDKGFGSKPKIIDIVRGKVSLEESEASGKIKLFTEAVTDDVNSQKVLKQYRIGIIDLPSFYMDFAGKKTDPENYKSTSRDIKVILKEMEVLRIDGLILNLRGNGGGSLEEAVKTAGLFFPENPIVQVSYSKYKRPRVLRDDDGKTYYDGPLVVMVNQMSASASEIVAGAIQDSGRGIIVGDISTHGKGTVQTVSYLDKFFKNSSRFKDFKPGALKFTIQKFYRINGGSTQKKGITPDITFNSYTEALELGEKHLDHVMAWDKIKPARIDWHNKEMTKIFTEIKSKHQKRLTLNPEFTELYKDIKEYTKTIKDKIISLNKKKRLRERKENKEKGEKRKKLLHLKDDQDDEDEKKKDEKIKIEPAMDENDDLYMRETLRIIVDLIDINKQSAKKPSNKRKKAFHTMYD
ncbi:MAG: carboxy terminal-processing peptidase [Verrucomicrobiota bacterium]|nr:carboxy terminal-processing peptidase [Verrucomicrobiota bacterium]